MYANSLIRIMDSRQFRHRLAEYANSILSLATQIQTDCFHLAVMSEKNLFLVYSISIDFIEALFVPKALYFFLSLYLDMEKSENGDKNPQLIIKLKNYLL